MDSTLPHGKAYLFVEKYFYKVLRKVYRSTLRLRKNPRPVSNPYITGDSFRALAAHVHDETGSFDPKSVKYGDIVFIGSPQMHGFFTDLHPHIESEYILIQHNGDIQTDETILPYIDDKIFRFYAQITTVSHPKIIPIPIGINNMHHGVDGFRWLMERRLPKQKLARIFYHFNNVTNPKEREPAAKYFATLPTMETMHAFVPYGTYKDILASYMFTVSPAGNTLGSHRTWEALYLRTLPIVKRTVDAESCVALGLPIWILDEWQELSAHDEAGLTKKYEEMMRTANFEALYMDYWIDRIRKDQAELRAAKV
jgi:hypothetical protein